jgi:hypothetical protein
MEQNWGDETKCTYAEGYIDQPVYSCRECSEKTGKQVILILRPWPRAKLAGSLLN